MTSADTEAAPPFVVLAVAAIVVKVEVGVIVVLVEGVAVVVVVIIPVEVSGAEVAVSLIVCIKSICKRSRYTVPPSNNMGKWCKRAQTVHGRLRRTYRRRSINSLVYARVTADCVCAFAPFFLYYIGEGLYVISIIYPVCIILSRSLLIQHSIAGVRSVDQIRKTAILRSSSRRSTLLIQS